MIRVENKSGNDNVTELEEHLEEKSVLSSVKSCKEAMVSENSLVDFGKNNISGDRKTICNGLRSNQKTKKRRQ